MCGRAKLESSIASVVMKIGEYSAKSSSRSKVNYVEANSLSFTTAPKRVFEKNYSLATRSSFWFATFTNKITNGSMQCWKIQRRSEEHTSELQSRGYLICRL